MKDVILKSGIGVQDVARLHSQAVARRDYVMAAIAQQAMGNAPDVSHLAGQGLAMVESLKSEVQSWAICESVIVGGGLLMPVVEYRKCDNPACEDCRPAGEALRASPRLKLVPPDGAS